MSAFNPFSLENKTIIITGAASGIGRQCAIDCSHMGAKVIMIDRNEEELRNDNILSLFKTPCSTYCYDLSDTNGIEDLVKQIVEENAPVDGMIHAAGIEKTMPFSTLKMEDVEHLFLINTVSGLELSRVISKKKYRGISPHFVFIASIVSVVGRPGVTAYAASKGALVSAVKSIALEFGEKGMTINCISPGTILTPMMQKMMNTLSEGDRNKRKEGFPLGLGNPSDISNTCIFLLSDAARWITGQNIIVDGGYTSR